ncbi:MAG: methylated-DNA--[protein]-cysteine S-methyltransferase [Eubacteriales bacterium]
MSGIKQRMLEPDPFAALASSIIAQQLSVSAANSIWARLQTLVGEIAPENIAPLGEGDLRACGLSFQKIGYLKNISDAFLTQKLSNDFFRTADDSAIIQALTAVKGIGQWTAEMFLIFSLGREDVFSYGDLGLRKGMAWLYSLPGEPSREFAKIINALWSPYNSVASLYLWEVTLQGLKKRPRILSLYPEFSSIPGGEDFLDTPIGTLKIVSIPTGLSEISFCPPAPETHCACPLIIETKKQLREYFNQKRRVFDLPLSPEGSDAHRTVWMALRTVSFGQTLSAKDVAARVSPKTSIQAVTAAVQKNRLQIVVPSHRLVRSDGRPTDQRHSWLLAHERA